jgi:hypothetical protein
MKQATKPEIASANHWPTSATSLNKINAFIAVGIKTPMKFDLHMLSRNVLRSIQANSAPANNRASDIPITQGMHMLINSVQVSIKLM